MQRLTFTCVITSVEGVENTPTALRRFVNLALTHGDKHQDFATYSISAIEVEEYEGDE